MSTSATTPTTSPAKAGTGGPLLEVQDLKVHFKTPRGILRAVNGVSFSLDQGTIRGIVGESGSGKSVLSRALMGLTPKGAIAALEGTAMFDGHNLIGMKESELRRTVRGTEIAMIFQDPMTALNPVMKIGKQIAKPLTHHRDVSAKDAKAMAIDLLDQVGIPSPSRRLGMYPHELSGGMRQRVMIAIALSCSPRLLIADEPTTALDVTVQSQILDLFETLRAERGLSILLISHDLNLIAERCDDVSVMYAGRVLEEGPAAQVFEKAAMPYTALLEMARPRLEDPSHTPLQTIPGRPPDLVNPPSGCPFQPRCPRATEVCSEEFPPTIEPAPGRSASCWHPLDGNAAEQLSVRVTGKQTEGAIA